MMGEYVVSYILNRKIVLNKFDREREVEEDIGGGGVCVWGGNVPPPPTQTGILHTV